MSTIDEGPTQLKLGFRTYDLVSELPDGQNLATFDFLRGQIRICPGLDDGVAAQTLLHEILHGLWYHYGLPDQGEGDAVNRLSFGLAAAMRDNPEVFRWLAAALHMPP